MKRIGFIGTSPLDEPEAATLAHIGETIARLGHTILIPPHGSPAPMAVAAGALRAGGTIETPRDTPIITAADHTFIYHPTPQLLAAITRRLGPWEELPVTIITPSDLNAWATAIDEYAALMLEDQTP
jgi:hypothetical protein